ncbi:MULTISPECIES: SRPBCC family protein [unclassified Citricoccus]|uniref:SRPBCC family protein n=1 Tax=Citricoccus TaxID=169133 RepID=UPI000255DE96|nr:MULTISPECIES: SRPBCC family protein [unclassified Citricoccus]HRO29728.1 SRPBCC family protein [Citricoccus sp.]
METFTALEDEIVVHLPTGRVWELLTDWAAAPVWLPGVDEMHVNGPVGPGQELTYVAGGHERQYTLSTFDPGHGLTMVNGTDDSDLRVEYGYLLLPDGDWTRVQLRVAVRSVQDLHDEAEDLATALADAEATQLEEFRAYAEKAP